MIRPRIYASASTTANILPCDRLNALLRASPLQKTLLLECPIIISACGNSCFQYFNNHLKCFSLILSVEEKGISKLILGRRINPMAIQNDLSTDFMFFRILENGFNFFEHVKKFMLFFNNLISVGFLRQSYL
jgi:hypothetical protein